MHICIGASDTCNAVKHICYGASDVCNGVKDICIGASDICIGASNIWNGVKDICNGASDVWNEVKAITFSVSVAWNLLKGICNTSNILKNIRCCLNNCQKKVINDLTESDLIVCGHYTNKYHHTIHSPVQFKSGTIQPYRSECLILRWHKFLQPTHLQFTISPNWRELMVKINIL